MRKNHFVTDEHRGSEAAGQLQRLRPGPGRETARNGHHLAEAERLEQPFEGEEFAARHEPPLVIARDHIAPAIEGDDAVEDARRRYLPLEPRGESIR